MIQPLHSGPLDIVGDVHGEIDALQALMSCLGYRADGTHPNGRRLVFIGDLTDRGPDSPAVLELVMGLVSRDEAQCVLGNHELNLLREQHKDGNGWFYAEDHDRRKNSFLNTRPLAAEKRGAVLEFLHRLPVALERDDLRLVHAAWHAPSISQIRASHASPLKLFNESHARAVALAEATGFAALSRKEQTALGEGRRNQEVPIGLMLGIAAEEAVHQDANPVAIVTSGLERIAATPFYASGKWRMLDRVAWWDDYREETPVVMGHYWRWPTSQARAAHSRGEPDLFEEYASHHWFGARRNVFCVDFAVGARYKERAAGATTTFECRLAAVRWPEREVMFDDGARAALL